MWGPGGGMRNVQEGSGGRGEQGWALESAEPTCVSTALSQKCSLVPGSSTFCFTENP